MNPFHSFHNSNGLSLHTNPQELPRVGGSNILPALDSIRHSIRLLTSLVPANPMLYSVLNENLNQLQQDFHTQQMELSELKLRHQVERMQAEKEISRFKADIENAQQKIGQSTSARLDAEKIRYYEVEISQLNAKLKERDRKIEDLKSMNKKLSLEGELSAKIVAELRDDLLAEEAKLTRLRVLYYRLGPNWNHLLTF